jgi:hypothetical protein
MRNTEPLEYNINHRFTIFEIDFGHTFTPLLNDLKRFGFVVIPYDTNPHSTKYGGYCIVC